MRLAVLIFVALAPGWGVVSAAAKQRVAVFDFELIDTSLEGSTSGPRADEAARLKKLGQRLREALAQSGKFDVVDIGPVASAANASNLQACGGCDATMAKKGGADLSITGTVQKISNLLFDIKFYVRGNASQKTIVALKADFRGNNQQSPARG